jgi:hypothetical protein
MTDKEDRAATARADLEALKNKYNEADDATKADARDQARAAGMKAGDAQTEADKHPN